ncbi:MAG: glycosyltransferase [Bacteroidia bacterium]|nr:glycosyltransferase family 4 protein [Bacteroidia bacterium]NNC84448.1 glycosyltransferase [Bacteroidia bacterium]NNM15917.1 glycosyltransferase [Bacteroidia bacterium]
MKVVLVSTYDVKGGAAIACNRLQQALIGNGIDAKMLVQYKSSEQDKVVSVDVNRLNRFTSFLKFAWERFVFKMQVGKKEDLFKFSLANVGKSISNHPLIKEADIIHLHWTQQGFLSIRELENLQKLNKPIVWTLHDMWAFTGGCHYSEGCKHFEQSCGNCHLLKNSSETDLSRKIWNKKKKAYSNIEFVTCSQWLRDVAKSSGLLSSFNVTAIANPIDTNVFSSENVDGLLSDIDSNKKLILFGAMNLKDERKGYTYFIDCLKKLKKNYPELSENIELITFGKADASKDKELPFKINYCGFLSDPKAIAAVYSKASVFILPSLEDNLPNTVMESLACNTPVVAFNTGGIPEMVQHKKIGYIAKYKSADDLTEGMKWVLEDESRFKQLSENAREYVKENYSFNSIATHHIQLYNKLKEEN